MSRQLMPSRWLLLFAIFASRAGALPAAERFSAVFADGSRVVGEELRDWYDTKSEPKLADRKLLDPKNPVRWIIDTSQLPGPPSPQFVEYVGGDRLPGRVSEYFHGEENDYDRLPPHLLIEPSVGAPWPDSRGRRPQRVTTRWLRRVAWEARGVDRYQPGTLFHRDGRQLAYRALRWRADSVRILVAEGTTEIPFSQIAELHLPRADAWDAYCEQVALISPECKTPLVRVDGEGGLRLTASLERLQARNSGSHPDHWFHALQPAWALDPVWLKHRSIRSRSILPPHELPLSAWEPSKVDQHYVLAGAWNWQRDRSVQGGSLRVAGEDYGWGLGVHAQCGLTFELPKLGRRFSAKVGLDEAVGSGGCARAIAYLNGADASPAFKSALLIGTQQPVDLGSLELPPENGKNRTLTLLADAAHADRPKGADPLDIRDLVNWLEPLVELDADVLREEVARRAPSLVPAWDDWDVVEADAGPALLVNYWDETDARRLRYQPLVRTRQKLLSLTQKVEITPDEQALLLCVSRPAGQSAVAKLLVEADGKPLGTFEVPERRGTAEPDPIYIPLEAYRGREVELRMTQSPLGPQSLIEWRMAGLVAHWPGALPVFEDSGEVIKDLVAAGTVSLDGEQAFAGTSSIKLLPTEAPDPNRLELELPIRESPRLGEYRFVRFAWKVAGEGRVCCSIGHDGLWGPDGEARVESRRVAPRRRSFRYDAGRDEPSYGGAMRIDKQPPRDWVVVTRDLYTDFGEFTLTGLSFGLPTGEAAWVDHVYFARSLQDFSRVEAKPRGKE